MLRTRFALLAAVTLAFAGRVRAGGTAPGNC
jgi:hypothetical protein